MIYIWVVIDGDIVSVIYNIHRFDDYGWWSDYKLGVGEFTVECAYEILINLVGYG